jgi:transposase
VGQLGFYDLDKRLEALSAKGDPLEALNSIVPFESFRAEIEAVVRLAPEERKSNAGRKPFDAVMMFKVLVLQTLYNLADEQVEYQIRDRLSFMRFLGLGLEDAVPDATTVWLFREALTKANLVKALFERFNGCLNARGYIARGVRSSTPALSAHPSSTTAARRTRRSRPARRPRAGRRSRPRMRRRTRMPAGPRRTTRASTATRTTSASTASTS